MRRFDGYIGFNRDWDSYEEGFGDTSGEFWLGLRSMEKIHADSKFSIRLDMETSDGSKDYAEYTNCELGDWQTMYTLTVGSFVGKWRSHLTGKKYPYGPVNIYRLDGGRFERFRGDPRVSRQSGGVIRRHQRSIKKGNYRKLIAN